MNKKFLSAILFGALMVTSTGTFVSCKDYDDDIDAINKELTDIKSQIAALQSKIDAGKYITSVSKTDKGLTFTLSDNSTYEVTNGENGEKGEKGDGNKLTIDNDGQWLIDGVATGWYCAKKGETTTVIVPEVGEDGYWYFVNKETGKLEQSTIKAAPVSVVEANGICTLTVVNADGTTTTVKLPTVAASITGISIISVDESAVASDYTVNWGESYNDQPKWKGPKGTIAKGDLLLSTTTSLYVQVIPSTADLSIADLKLVGSDNSVAPVNVVATAYNKPISRAASASGVWKLDITPTASVNTSNIANAFNFNDGGNKKDYAYALQVNGVVLTTYGTKVTVGDAKGNTTLTASDLKGYSTDKAAVVIEAGKEVEIGYASENAYDAYLTIQEATKWEAQGVTVKGNTMIITSPASLAGQNGPKVTVNYLDYKGEAKTVKDVQIVFAGEKVDPEVKLADVAYKVGENHPKVIINMGTFFTSLTAADAVNYAAATKEWAVTPAANADKFVFALNSATIKYYSELNAAGTDGNPSKEVTMSSADQIRNAKYAVISGTSYQTDTKLGAHSLTLTFAKTSSLTTELKKAIVTVNVSVPTWDELFSNSKAFSGNVLNALLSATNGQYNMTNAFIKKNDNVDWTHLVLTSETNASGAAYASYDASTKVLTMASVLLNNGVVSKNIKMNGYYAIGGSNIQPDKYGDEYEANNLIVKAPEFEVKFITPFNDVKFNFYKDNSVVSEIPVTLSSDGKATIAHRTGAGTNNSKYQGLTIKASDEEKAFDNSIDLFNITSTGGYALTVEDVADGAKAELTEAGIELSGMPKAATYKANIKVVITDANGIKTTVKIPLSVK